LLEWLAQGWHGEMEYMARHGALRARPASSRPATLRVISCRMDYGSDLSEGISVAGSRAVIARYARGRDYHKVLRDRLQKLSDRISAEVGAFGHRVFSDSAPVMDGVELAARAGLGWRGKHTMLLSRDAGSCSFSARSTANLALPIDQEEKNSCGSCEALHRYLPTQAIRGPLPAPMRGAAAFRISPSSTSGHPRGAAAAESATAVYGCDDCQVVCPVEPLCATEPGKGFAVRNGLDRARWSSVCVD
jgi:epoxyqueuosine reductase